MEAFCFLPNGMKKRFYKAANKGCNHHLCTQIFHRSKTNNTTSTEIRNTKRKIVNSNNTKK